MLKLTKLACLGAVATLLCACGENPLSQAFKNISIKNLDQDGNAVVELRAEVGNGNVVFSSGTLPIVDPKTGKSLGSIAMERTLEGQNILVLTANVTGLRLAQPLSDNKLPNGNNVPVAGLTSLLAVPAGQHSRVYIGESGDKIMIGVAVAIEQFDNLSRYIPGASVFFNLPSDSKMAGVAGFFTSSQTGKSGLGIFTQTSISKPSLLSSNSSRLEKSMSISNSSNLRYLVQDPSNEQANYFGYFVNKWSRSKTQLKLK